MTDEFITIRAKEENTRFSVSTMEIFSDTKVYLGISPLNGGFTNIAFSVPPAQAFELAHALIAKATEAQAVADAKAELPELVPVAETVRELTAPEFTVVK